MSARAHNDGGPAFPRNITVFGHQNKIDADTGTGMSLRDWFAGQALPALISAAAFYEQKAAEEAAKKSHVYNYWNEVVENLTDESIMHSFYPVVFSAYEIADLLLEVRKEEQE